MSLASLFFWLFGGKCGRPRGRPNHLGAGDTPCFRYGLQSPNRSRFQRGQAVSLKGVLRRSLGLRKSVIEGGPRRAPRRSSRACGRRPRTGTGARSTAWSASADVGAADAAAERPLPLVLGASAGREPPAGDPLDQVGVDAVAVRDAARVEVDPLGARLDPHAGLGGDLGDTPGKCARGTPASSARRRGWGRSAR